MLSRSGSAWLVLCWLQGLHSTLHTFLTINLRACFAESQDTQLRHFYSQEGCWTYELRARLHGNQGVDCTNKLHETMIYSDATMLANFFEAAVSQCQMALAVNECYSEEI